MKRLTIAVCLSMLVYGQASAQDNTQNAAAEAAKALTEAPQADEIAVKPCYWTNSVDFELGFNQTGLWNWAAGGFNTMTLGAGIDAKADYAKDLASWNNRLQLNYGFLWSADKRNLLQKSNDRIYLESKFAYKTGPSSKWNYTASLDFRTQFSEGYSKYEEVNGEWVGVPVSDFISPAYTNLSLGLEWVPNDWFNLNIAPVTGGIVHCTNAAFREAYGMKPVNPDNLALGYRSALFQLGAQIKANLKLSINDKFLYETQLVLFTDYLDHPFASNRVNWDNKISWQAAKFFKVSLNTWLIYDPLVMIDNGNGVPTQMVQFKEFFAISFSYSIANRKD